MTTTAPETSTRSRRTILRGVLASMALLICCAGQAEAQWGFGPFGGFGWGFARPYTPPSVNMLNERANVRAGMDQEALNRTSLSTPDRFDYRRQQVSMQQRYDVSSTRGMEVARAGRGTPIPGTRASATERPTPPVANQPPAVERPILEITSFVNQQDRLVWPSDAPVSGDLITKRDQADEAIHEVVQEYRAMNAAQINTVASAREDLIAYGQPALQYLRETSTARVADTFHLFLLSLYDSLAQAAEQGIASQTR
ncbi:hypothetical protein [Tautonia marina]|uniref:hypothetical protein n=1 Tax=Tautonia marina TaxID=2653855 RepID=UPI00126118EC|nr:hypothetical protein [Tautonia marina]